MRRSFPGTRREARPTASGFLVTQHRIAARPGVQNREKQPIELARDRQAGFLVVRHAAAVDADAAVAQGKTYALRFERVAIPLMIRFREDVQFDGRAAAPQAFSCEAGVAPERPGTAWLVTIGRLWLGNEGASGRRDHPGI